MTLDALWDVWFDISVILIGQAIAKEFWQCRHVSYIPKTSIQDGGQATRIVLESFRWEIKMPFKLAKYGSEGFSSGS